MFTVGGLVTIQVRSSKFVALRILASSSVWRHQEGMADCSGPYPTRHSSAFVALLRTGLILVLLPQATIERNLLMHGLTKNEAGDGRGVMFRPS